MNEPLLKTSTFLKQCTSKESIDLLACLPPAKIVELAMNLLEEFKQLEQEKTRLDQIRSLAALMFFCAPDRRSDEKDKILINDLLSFINKN